MDISDLNMLFRLVYNSRSFCEKKKPVR
jgi:hypothetical protein